MKLTVLIEDVAGRFGYTEHGLSYFLEIKNHTVLFDTGASSLFIKNAERLGIDIHKRVNTVVLSHGHYDHGGGLYFLEGKDLILHPNAFIKRYHKKNNIQIGLSKSKFEIQKKINIIETKVPYFITDYIIFLGEIPRENKFESKNTDFVDEYGVDDYVIDDSALAIIQNNELIIISGCAHSGICNIVQYAQKVTGITNIKTVIGGFHLKNRDEQTLKTISFLRKNKIKEIFPSHCTELPVLSLFYDEFNIKQIKTGDIINI